jgi:tetratricopeptide (TPR) repeat protein
MFITSTLAVVAYRARNEAQFQRTQAEQLIGFMLGNLRDKLEAVNRLDILDDVADHTMGYFQAQQHDGGASAERQRANALLMVGRIRVDQGRLDEADRAFRVSLAAAEKLNAASPGDPALQVARADAQSWLGMVAWYRGNPDKALVHFHASQPDYAAAVRAQPRQPEWITHESWAHNSVGHILESKGALDAARAEYEAYLATSRRVAAMKPHDDVEVQRVAEAHDNLGQLFFLQGNLPAAERAYRDELVLLEGIAARDPRNANAKTALAQALTFYARIAGALGHDAAARDSLDKAVRLGETLLADDAGNAEKMGDVAAANRRLARLQRLDGNLQDAASHLARSEVLFSKMLSMSPDSMRARVGLALSSLEHAWLASAEGDTAAAETRARDATTRCSAILKEHDDDRGASLASANALLLLGHLADTRGQHDTARQDWNDGLSALSVFGHDSNDPDHLATQAQLLQRLGRSGEARPILARLDAMGYRDSEFVAWAKGSGIRGEAVAVAGNAAR